MSLMNQLNFASDNAGPAHPKLRDALVRACDDYAMPYGNDGYMDRARGLVRETFDAPEAEVFLVSTGSAANALALSAYAKPWDAVFCHRISHVEEDECGAPEFYSGAKLRLVDGADAKMSPDGLRASIEGVGGAVHNAQRGPVSVTQATELGTVYSCAEIAELTLVAAKYGLATHLDGARFANAVANLGCNAADMTWKSGVDVVSFGGTKNGCPNVEAVIFFDPSKAWEFQLRRKRGGHLLSKHRFLSAQLEAYLTDDLWLENAAKANAACAYLADGLRAQGVDFMAEPEANMVFAHLPRAGHERAKKAGALYYEVADDGGETVTCRLVCDWSRKPEDIDVLLRHFAG